MQILRLVFWFRNPARATPGRSTATKISSRRGPTIPSPILPEKRSTSATKAPAKCGRPTALPIRDETAPYIARHGQGYSRFHHGSHGILLELLQFVPPEDPIKISRLTLKNDSGRARRLSVTAYAEWVLGSSRSASAPYIITEVDSQTGALFARSAWGGEFGGRIAFADLGGQTDFCHRRPHGISWPQRHAGASRGAGTRRPAFRKSGSRPRSLRRAANSIELRPGATRGNRVFPGPGGKQGASARIAGALSRRRLECDPCRSHGPLGRHARAPCRSPRPIRPWIC